MKNSLTINLTSDEIKQIKSFCKLNKIEEVDDFVTKCFKHGLRFEMYGLLGDDSGKTGGVQKKWVEKEVIVEKRVEIPVEKIVEKIVEKPVIVEKIIEIPVETIKEKEKIVYISDDEKVNELTDKIKSLEIELKEEKENIKTIQVIKEIVKEVTIQDDTKIEMMQKTLGLLRNEILEKKNKIETLERTILEFNSLLENKPALYHRGSNINEKLL